MVDSAKSPREGDTQDDDSKKSCCHRPGCYVRFTPPPQAPQQKYCSVECYEAMRVVLVREKRWREKVLREKQQRRKGPS